MKNGRIIYVHQQASRDVTGRLTRPEPVALRLVIEEDEGEAQDEGTPKDEQTSDEVDEAAHGEEVAERLGPQEARERILLELSEDVRLLQMEQVGDQGRCRLG